MSTRSLIHKRDMIKWIDHLFNTYNIKSLKIEHTGVDNLFYRLEVEFDD